MLRHRATILWHCVKIFNGINLLIAINSLTHQRITRYFASSIVQHSQKQRTGVVHGL